MVIDDTMMKMSCNRHTHRARDKAEDDEKKYDKFRMNRHTKIYLAFKLNFIDHELDLDFNDQWLMAFCSKRWAI